MRYFLMGGVVAAGLASCVPQPSAPVADSKNRVVDIVNTTDATVTFFATNGERRRASREHFAEQEVRENHYSTVNFVDGSGACLFEFHAVSAIATRAVTEKIDTCTEVSWVILPEMFQ